MLKEVFKDIQERLKTIPGFRYIGEDWGQLNFEQPPVDWPCALIDLGEVAYTSAGQGRQQTEATVNITIADLRYNGLTPNLPQPDQDKAFEIFDLIDKVNTCLHGTGGEHYSRLCRVSLKKILREDAVREFIMTYKFSYTDDTAMPAFTQLTNIKSHISIQQKGLH